MTHEEAQKQLSHLLEKANHTLGVNHKLIFIDQTLQLRPGIAVPRNTPIIATITPDQIKNGLNVTQWITLTRKISLDSERIP